MAENDAAFGLPANMPESVRARLMAARLLQQGAAAQTAPYTSRGVVAAKAFEGLLGGLQERQVLQEARQGQMAGNASLVDLGNALRNGTSSGAMAAGGAAAAPAAPGMIPGSVPTSPANALPSGGDSTRDLAIRTIAGEAGGEPDVGKAGVAAVLKNRLASGQFGPDMRSVILAPKQFSLWNPGDPAGDTARRLDPSSPTYQHIGAIYDGVMSGQTPDPTGGATHYYNPRAASPDWGPKLAAQNDVTIGNHRFVGLGPAGPNGASSVASAVPSAPAGTIGDASALAAQNRIASGQGSDADRALLVSYRQQQNAPQRTASADTPAPNAQAVSSSTLPPGITPDMVSGAGTPPTSPSSPFGSMPSSMAQPPATPDPTALMALLRGQADGSGPGATPLPATVQPSSPFGSMPASMNQAPASVPAPSMVGAPPPSPQSSPFGAGPQPMQDMGGADRAMVAQLLAQGGQGQAAPAAPQISSNAVAMGDLMPGGPGPAALDPSGAALPPVAASGLSSAQLPGMDNFAGAPDGTVRQTSIVDPNDPSSTPGFTGSFGPGIQPSISGALPPPSMLAQGSADMPVPAPLSPSPAMLGAALRNPSASSAPGPTPLASLQASAPTPVPPPNQAGQQTAALLPGGVDDFGRTPDQAMAGAPPSLPDVTTAAMAKAGYDTTGLPGAQPKPPAPPLPTMAGANVPPPDLSGLGGQPTPPAGSGLPIMARQSSNPPAALQQDFAGLSQQHPPVATSYTSTEPTSRPGAQAMRQPKPGDVGGPPLPVSRPSNVALGLDPDAPSPGAVAAGPAPLTNPMARALAQQPMGVPGNSPTSDPSSPQNFMRQEAQRAAGGPSYTNPTARALAGQTAPTPQTAQQPDDGNPLSAIGRLFGQGGNGQGGLGGMLGNLPIIGGMLGGQGQGGQMGNGFPTNGTPSPTSALATSAAYGGQGQGQSFAPGGQGAQPGAAQGGQGASASGVARAQAIAGQILQNPYAPPEAREAASKVLFSMPSYQKMDDGTLLMTDPLTRQTTVVGRYGKPEVLKPGDALRDPYTGAPIGPTQATPDRFKEGANGSILDQTTGRTAADPNAFTMSEVEVNGVKVPVRIGRNADGSPNVQMMVPGAGAQSGAPGDQPGATPSGGPLDGMVPLVQQANDMAARQAAAKEGAVDQVKGANTFVQATAKQSAEAANHVQEMQQLKALGSAAPTGWSADMARYAADHGFQTATGDAVKSYDGMRAYLGTQLRQAGSGALRNSEMDKLSDALGSTNVSPATRAAAVQRIQDGFARQSALGQVASDPSLPDPMAKQARIQDVQQTWMNADAAIEAHPDKRAAIVAKMQAAGYPVVGF